MTLALFRSGWEYVGGLDVADCTGVLYGWGGEQCMSFVVAGLFQWQLHLCISPMLRAAVVTPGVYYWWGESHEDPERKSANEDSHTEYFKGSIGGKQNIPSSFPNGVWGACHQEACALGQTSPPCYSCFPPGERLWGFTQKLVQYDHVLMRKTA